MAFFQRLFNDISKPAISISPDYVSRAGLARERMDEVVLESIRGVGENTDGRPAAGDDARLWPRDHLSDTLLVPIRRPKVTVIDGEGKPLVQRARPESCQPPIKASSRVRRCPQNSGPCQRQLGNPVGVELVGGVEIRHARRAVRIKCVD